MKFFRRIVCIVSIALFFHLSGLLPATEAAARGGGKRPGMAGKKTRAGKKRRSHADKKYSLREEWQKPRFFRAAEADDLFPAEERELSVEAAAYSLLGRRYRFGGDGRNGIDCSAFVRSVFSSVNVPLPRTAREQFRLGKDISPQELQPGDLLFFATYAPYASHVGIYLGGGRMIHASSREGKVTVSSTSDSYLSPRFLGARRIEGGGKTASLLADLKPAEVEDKIHDWREEQRKGSDLELAAALMKP